MCLFCLYFAPGTVSCQKFYAYTFFFFAVGIDVDCSDVEQNLQMNEANCELRDLVECKRAEDGRGHHVLLFSIDPDELQKVKAIMEIDVRVVYYDRFKLIFFL